MQRQPHGTRPLARGGLAKGGWLIEGRLERHRRRRAEGQRARSGLHADEAVACTVRLAQRRGRGGEPSRTDPFFMREADGRQVAKNKASVTEENERSFVYDCTDVSCSA